MKLGTSYSRCLRDIVDGVVNINNVMVIVARTDFDPENDSQWSQIWEGYAGNGSVGMWSHPEWHNYQGREQEFRDLSIKLKKAGKLHQPRQFGAYPQRMPEYWYDLVLTADTLADNPAAKKAFENYKLIAGLAK
jgi:hypothetical protein